MSKRRKYGTIIKIRSKKPLDKRFVANHLLANKDEETNGNKVLCDRAYIYSSEIEYIGRCILDCPNIETGGQLFGYWTASGAPVVVYAIGPGPKANHQVAFFNQDLDYLEQVGNILVSKFGLMHIGEWHSHHQLGLDRPSGHDAHTMQSTIDKRHLNRFLLCIGNCKSGQYSIKPYNFFEGQSSFVNSSWVIKGEISPLRKLIDGELKNNSLSLVRSESLSNNENIKETWFDKKENRVQLKLILDYISSIPTSKSAKAHLEGKEVKISVEFPDRNELISFPTDFPGSPIYVTRSYLDGAQQEKKALEVSVDKDSVFEAFVEQYKTINI